MKDSKNSRDSFMEAFAIYGAIGFQLVILIAGGAYLGRLGDQKWDLEPLLTITGLLLGTVAGFYQLIKLVNLREKKRDNDE